MLEMQSVTSVRDIRNSNYIKRKPDLDSTLVTTATICAFKLRQLAFGIELTLLAWKVSQIRLLLTCTHRIRGPYSPPTYYDLQG